MPRNTQDAADRARGCGRPFVRLPKSARPTAVAWALIAAGAPGALHAQEDPSGGMYARAGAVRDWFATARFVDTDCSSSSPAALYGCGTGVDGAPTSSVGDFSRADGVGLALGYALPFVRFEAIVRHRPNLHFSGRANFIQTTAEQPVAAELSVLSGMLAMYGDLPGIGRDRLRPFVGAGAGGSRVRIGEMRMEFPRTTTVVPDGRRSNTAWMFMAGITGSVAEHLLIDVAWTYSDVGAVETGQAVGHVVWRDQSRQPLPLDLAATTADLSFHGIGITLRQSL